MRVHALDEAVAIQEAAAGLKEIMDRPVAGEDLFVVSQIVQGDGGDG